MMNAKELNFEEWQKTVPSTIREVVAQVLTEINRQKAR